MRHKILFISSWFPNKLQPQNGNFVQRHAEAVATVHDVEILHAVGDDYQKEKFLFDDKVINGIRTLIVYYKNSANPARNFIRRLKAYKEGFSKLTKPDLVHANVMHNNMLFAVRLKRKLGIPYVVSEHWTALRTINHQNFSIKKKMIARLIGNNAAYILPVSEELGNGIREIGIKTQIKVIPNVVDTEIFKPSTGLKTDFVFLHVSTLIERKNPDKILEAAINLLKRGYRFKLMMGGTNDKKIQERLKAKISEAGFENEIEIFGEEDSDAIAGRMRAANCFILFSNDENQPCVIAEAFSTGIKVISTNVGGIPEFFPENSGVLLKEVDTDLLEAAMIKVMDENSSDSKEEIRNYAVETFSKQAIAEQFDKIYQQVLKQ